MNVDKDKVLEKLLDGQPLDDAEAAYVRDHDDLAGITDFLEAIKGVDLGQEPPKALDDAILAEVHGPVSKPSTKPVAKRPTLVYVRLGLAAAAAFLIVMIVLQLLPQPGSGEGPIVKKEPVTPKREQVVVPEAPRTPDQQVVDKPNKNTVPDFDWGDGGGVESEVAVLCAELYFENLDDNDAVLVENFEVTR